MREDFFVNNDYKVSNNGEIIKYIGLDDNIILPLEINNIKITSIGDNAFLDKINIKSITFDKNSYITSINYGAFYNCNKLTSITIPKNIIFIGNHVFSYCSSLTEINVHEENNNYMSIDGILYYKDPLKLYKFPEGKTDTSIFISNNMTIDLYAFIGNNKLININVDENNNNYTSINGVLFNKEKDVIIRFPPGKIEEEYTIPNNVIKINNYAFNSCNNLTNIIMSNGLVEIGYGAFTKCNKLLVLNIPNSVMDIYPDSFNDSPLVEINVDNNNKTFSSIDGILLNKTKDIIIKYPEGKANIKYTIPESITEIGIFSFSNSKNINTIYISKNVKIINMGAFINCVNLTEIFFEDNKNMIIDSYAFNNIGNNVKIYYNTWTEDDINNFKIYADISKITFINNQQLLKSQIKLKIVIIITLLIILSLIIFFIIYINDKIK